MKERIAEDIRASIQYVIDVVTAEEIHIAPLGTRNFCRIGTSTQVQPAEVSAGTAESSGQVGWRSHRLTHQAQNDPLGVLQYLGGMASHEEGLWFAEAFLTHDHDLELVRVDFV